MFKVSNKKNLTFMENDVVSVMLTRNIYLVIREISLERSGYCLIHFAVP